jgi:hypothetical protein
MRKALPALLLSLFALLCLILAASQIEQRIFRQRAERLLAEIQSLDLRITPWHEAQGRLQHWGTNERYDDQCIEQQCSLEITLIEPVYNFISTSLLFVHLDDYLRWRLKLSYDTGPFVRVEGALLKAYMLTGGRPAKVIATVGMRDGTVWSKGFQASIEAYWHVDELIALISNVESIPQFGSSTPDHGDPQLTVHPNYVINRQGGCCDDLGYVRFTPQADPDDVHRLMQFDLSCLTRLHPCVHQSDLMPAAWAQYLAEHPYEQEREGP